jgi:hypothetical protein
MEAMRECPFCAHGELNVIVVKVEPRVLAVHCPECGATGPSSLSPEPAHGIFCVETADGTIDRREGDVVRSRPHQRFDIRSEARIPSINNVRQLQLNIKRCSNWAAISR